MISTATTLIGLGALFLMGIKWTIDLVQQRPRKRSLSSYYEQQRSFRASTNNRATTETLTPLIAETQDYTIHLLFLREGARPKVTSKSTNV